MRGHELTIGYDTSLNRPQTPLKIEEPLNPDRIDAALEAEGFQVIDRTGSGDLTDESFILAAKLTGPGGHQYAFEFRGLRSHVDEMIYEFKSIQYIVDVARQMRDLAQQQLIEHGEVLQSP